MSGIFKALEKVFRPKSARRSKSRRSTVPPMNAALDLLSENMKNYTRRSKKHSGVKFNNAATKSRGFRFREAGTQDIVANNIAYVHNLIASRKSPRWKRTGNVSSYYEFTENVPKMNPGSVRLGEKNAAIFAKLHGNAKSREEFVNGVHRETRKGNLTVNAAEKLLKKYNALYPVEPLLFGGLTLEEIDAMEPDEFTEYIKDLDKNTLVRLEPYIE